MCQLVVEEVEEKKKIRASNSSNNDTCELILEWHLRKVSSQFIVASGRKSSLFFEEKKKGKS